MTIKSRVLTRTTMTTVNRSYGTPGTPKVVSPYAEVQRIITESHPGYKRRLGKGDVGGPFESMKIKCDYLGREWHGRYNFSPTLGWQNHVSTFAVPAGELSGMFKEQNTLGTDSQYKNWLAPRVPAGYLSHELIALGTKAIAAVKPTNPTVDLATTLAELWSERKFFSIPGRSGGGAPGEYLNYQFGIAPAAGAVQDLRNAIVNGDQIIDQYRRDSGRLVRRRYDFGTESETVTVVTNSVRPATIGVSFTTNLTSPGQLVKTSTTTKKVWFEGAFRYSIPKDALPRSVAELDRKYGIRPGIGTAWELLPFSWLVDYFTPIGALLDNLDSFLLDGLVMPYAYIMATTEVVEQYTWRGGIRNMDGLLVATELGARVTKTKLQRIPATPFGFGLLPGDLSAEQLSIIAALGLTLRK